MAELNLDNELAGYFRANVPLINLVTYEEGRVMQSLERIDAKLGIYAWDMADGFTVIREGQPSAAQEGGDLRLPFAIPGRPGSAKLRDRTEGLPPHTGIRRKDSRRASCAIWLPACEREISSL